MMVYYLDSWNIWDYHSWSRSAEICPKEKETGLVVRFLLKSLQINRDPIVQTEQPENKANYIYSYTNIPF